MAGPPVDRIQYIENRAFLPCCRVISFLHNFIRDPLPCAIPLSQPGYEFEDSSDESGDEARAKTTSSEPAPLPTGSPRQMASFKVESLRADIVSGGRICARVVALAGRD